jgi:hypothetical protein
VEEGWSQEEQSQLAAVRLNQRRVVLINRKREAEAVV